MAHFNACMVEKVQQGAQARVIRDVDSGTGGGSTVVHSDGSGAEVGTPTISRSAVVSAQPADSTAQAPQGEGSPTADVAMDPYLQEVMMAMTGEV